MTAHRDFGHGSSKAKFQGQDVYGRSSVRNGLGPQSDPHADTSKDGGTQPGIQSAGGTGESGWRELLARGNIEPHREKSYSFVKFF